MAIGDIFKSKKNEELSARIAELEAMLTPEILNAQDLESKIKENTETLAHIKAEIMDQQSLLSKIKQDIQAAQWQLVETNEEVLMQSFGLYTPRYSFANSTGYKEELSRIRTQQKDAIKNDKAVTGDSTGWTVNGSAQKGSKMVKDEQKIILRAFNCECDDVIEHVKFNNIEASEKRIRSSCATISKLGTTHGVSITDYYLSLKIQELYLAHEYQVEKQKEKERLKQLRAEEREQAKLEREIEEARKRIEKEQKHYTNALQAVLKQIATAKTPEEADALAEKKAELEEQLGEIGKSLKQIDYRAANQKAGYVYIISNVGAFGEGVYKIGMTRRLDPMDRIDELGDASVPFDFDVHALIFSENAPALEAALHHAFEDRKLNMINTRREFFRVSLDEIKKVVRENYDKTVEFVDIPPAEQYRESLLMAKAKVESLA